MAERHRELSAEKLPKEGVAVFHLTGGYGKDISLHHHDYYEIYLFLTGKITYLIEGKQYELQAGDCMMLAPGILHEPVFTGQLKKGSQNQYERYILRMDKQFLDAVDTSSLKLKDIFEHETVRLQEGNLKLLRQLFTLLLQYESLTGFGAGEMKAGCARQILILLCRGIQRESFLDCTASNPLIDRVLQYIAAHLTQDLSEERLAEIFFVNKFYLLREFKKHTGTTPYHYIMKKRLILAEELILQGRQVKDLYSECGFSDYSNFFRCFKKEYGQTPRQFYETKRSR
ncbi:MAG: AraC family transcriptional regulator [Oscillospiraceae bacterium]|nr:AraC family transcriptional regulator [Oscillospiraceae bacterium]